MDSGENCAHCSGLRRNRFRFASNLAFIKVVRRGRSKTRGKRIYTRTPALKRFLISLARLDLSLSSSHVGTNVNRDNSD